MPKKSTLLLSVVVPVHNEAAGLREFHVSLIPVVRDIVEDNYEVIYCDDGSTDKTATIVRDLNIVDPNVKLVSLSRNFGKESALTAGIAAAKGQAIVMLDGDGQHPVDLLPKFFEAWKDGAQVVIGMRERNNGAGLFKRLCSTLFYKVFNRLTGQKLLAGSTDFRLIDQAVQQAFLTLPESDRITRGLIDWLGFKRAYIPFVASVRRHGDAAYSFGQLLRLGTNSFVSLSAKPLYIFGYLGVCITFASFLLGTTVFVEQLLLGDPLHWDFTGTAMLAIIILFLVGIVLLSQGMLSLYISHIHSQTKQRPLYVIDFAKSIGYKNPHDTA
jgi:dolichol-phosphate mannosyltransferase